MQYSAESSRAKTNKETEGSMHCHVGIIKKAMQPMSGYQNEEKHIHGEGEYQIVAM
jgi:hypothetical protein